MMDFRYSYPREHCTVCGCFSSPNWGNDLCSLIATALPGKRFSVHCSGTIMLITFEKDLDPSEVALLDSAVASWVPPEYCDVIHFPP